MPSSSSPEPDSPPATAVELVARPAAEDALRAWLDDAGTLMAAAAAHPDAQTMQGRGRVYSVPSPDGAGRWVVRHYWRGGAVARLLGDRYLRLGTPRPVREYRLGRALEDRDIPTPVHVGAAVYTHGLWYRGDLVTEEVPDSADLATVLFPGTAAPPGRRTATTDESTDAPTAAAPDAASDAVQAIDRVDAMRVAGGLIRRLHDAGVVHPDLNLKNVLLTGAPPRALIVDLDKSRLRSAVTDRQRRRMIARFWRSARKWAVTAGAGLSQELHRAFEDGYG